MFLKHFRKSIEILYYKDPSFIKFVKYSDIVKQLFDTRLSDDEGEDKYIKKTISNVNCGLLEKGLNKSQKSFIFDNPDEALYYQKLYGGTLSVLRKLEVTEELVEDPLDKGLDTGDYVKETTEQDVGKKYYVLNLKNEKHLENGFRYIKELLLQKHNYKMYTAYKKLKKANVNVFSVKTDAFMIQQEHVDIAKSILKFSNNIGYWRVSKEDCSIHQAPPYAIVENELMDIKELTTTRLDIKDEWDVNELCQHIITNKRVMIRAKFPGSGKSYVCEHLGKLGYNVLFVCPTNKLAQKYKDSGITINKFYGVGFTDNGVKEVGTIKRGFDYSNYDVVVYDEIYFSSVRMLARIRKFCLENPDKIVVATGDTSQLPPIVDYSNTKDYATYADQCINNIFPYEIYLKENKRLKTQEDKDKLERIYNDIFNPEINLQTTIEKYFKFTQSLVTSNKGIAYMNDTCENVSKHVRKKLNKQTEYEIGEVLICREYLNLKKVGVFNVNFEFEILSVSHTMLNIRNIATGEDFELSKDVVKKNFIFSYCSTCHSTQGTTIDESITIYDWKFYFMTREWLWTAITRATSLDNVYFYDYVEPELNHDLMKAYFKRRIENYKEQDKERTKAKIPNEVLEKYIKHDWFLKYVNNCCPECNNSFYIGFRDGNTYTNITADRIDNSLYHTEDNIQPMCKNCNCSLR